MANLKSLVKDTAVYGLSSIIGRFLNYLLVTLYTYKMTAASGEYGDITYVYALTALLFVILTYGMETTFFRFANKSGENPQRVYGTVLWSVATTSVLFVALILLFLQPISSLFRYTEHPEYIACMFTVVALDALQAILFSYLRYQKKALKFASLKLLFIFLSIALNCIYYLGMDGHDAQSAFYINFICTFIITFFFYKELKGFTYGFDGALLKRMLRYAWPILLLGIAGILNQTADKLLFPYIYNGSDGKEQLAIYGAVVKIAMIMAMITQAFRYAYEPIVFGNSDRKDNDAYQAKATKYFIIFTLFAFICVVGYMDILRLLIGRDYWVGLRVVPIVMAAEIMMGVYFNLSFWYKLDDKTFWGAVFSFVGCAVLLAVNVFFVPKYGYVACAWGGFAGYLTAMVLSYLVGQKEHPVDYPLKDIALYVGLTAVLCLLMHFNEQMPALWLTLAANTLLIIAYLAVVIRKDLPTLPSQLSKITSKLTKSKNRMKRIILSLLCLASIAVARADEGMWTLYNLPQAVFNQMKAEGFGLDYDKLYASDDAVMRSVVNFSGFCSGVVVSPDGLVFTNHHCGFEAIRSHSTVEHDYMLNGFIANSYEEELPNERMFVSFMKGQTDITAALTKAGFFDADENGQRQLIDSLEKALSDSVRTIDKTYHVDIQPFYEGNAYYATTYQDFRDIRLVFAIPKSMGKFGGETDNWMWPRQTCDFSVFRIYADPETNGPAAYNEKNVPYHPQNWAPVSLEGYTEGDFAMTMGYPGSTSRYLSSYGIQERRDAQNEPRAQVRGVKQEVMKRHMDASEAVRIKYDSKYAQSSNYWKNSLGMNKCIDSIGLIRQKQDFEAKIKQWQDTAKNVKTKVDFNRLAELYGKRLEVRKALTNFTETFFGTSELNNRAMRIGRMPLQGSDKKPKKQYTEFADNSETWDAPLDKEVMAVLLENYRDKVPAEYLPKFYAQIDQKFGGNYAAYVDYLYQNSQLMQSGKKLYVNSKKFEKDPGYQYGLDLMEVMAELRGALMDGYEEVEEQERLLCDAKLHMEWDLPHYSDANFTMRLSYGQVKEFELGGQPSGWYTTPESIVKKMKQGDANSDYFAEPIMHELLSATDFGPYQDKNTGKMHLCFLTNNDITGGNSGSPMFDGKGRLIGLAFDGNWDSLASDILFDSHLARCIGVDIRFVLFMMDRWGHADRLLKEINAK